MVNEERIVIMAKCSCPLYLSRNFGDWSLKKKKKKKAKRKISKEKQSLLKQSIQVTFLETANSEIESEII
jgi:hypothetical protein